MYIKTFTYVHIRFTFKTKPVHYKFNTIINKGNTLYARSTIKIKIM